jgi:hypothetical protein
MPAKAGDAAAANHQLKLVANRAPYYVPYMLFLGLFALSPSP